MYEVLDDTMHGGDVVVRERVDTMWEYRDAAARAKQSAALLAHARRLYPWLPRTVEVRYGKAADYHHYLTVRGTAPAHVRADLIRDRMAAAETTRCNCGDYGSWDDGDTVSGTSGNYSCVWAGCSNCGSAVGPPVRSADLSWYERQAPKLARR